ncbi:cellulose binding domain-containing protein [Actinomadura sp. 3N508]|uniref:cellulose binding domain-containing protein n=1 Tax=Actinomadura sp. 3N508 TaxID=3375153 RepID=UPI0037B6D767
MDELSGQEPGYVPPDHRTTAEFRVPGRAAAPQAAAEPGPEATIVDEPVDDLIDPGVTAQDVTQVEEPAATFTDVPVDDLEDAPEDDPEDDHEVRSSVTVSDIPVPPKVVALEKPAQDADPATVPDEAPAAEQAAMHEQAPPASPAPAEPQAARPGTQDGPWTEQFGAEAESPDPGHGAAPPAPAPAPAPVPSTTPASGPAHAYVPPPSVEATAPAMAHVASPSGGVPPSGRSRSGRRVLLIALIGLVLLLAIAAAAVLLYNRGSETTGKATPTPPASAISPSASPGEPGGPPPDGAPTTPPAPTEPAGGVPGQPPATQAPAAPSVPIGPVLDGNGITYALVQQSQGYFEGRMVITNRTDRPMRAWRLTFQVPGATVKNIWGARLVKGGANAELRNLDGAPAIPPGGTWDVRFGASGATSTPKACRLNGRSCGF